MPSDRYLPGPRRRDHPPATHEVTRMICLEPLDAGSAGGSDWSSGVLELWQLLLANKRVMLAFAALGILAALALTAVQTPIYQARTIIEVQSLTETSLEPLGDSARTPGHTPESYLQTQARILASASVRSRVEARMQREQTVPYEAPARFAAIRRALRMAPAKAEAAGAGRLPHVSVQVKPYEHTRLIEVLCDAPDPEIAARYANTLTDEYVEYYLEARWNAAERATQWLTAQLDKLRVRLRESENKLQAYSRGAGLVFTSERHNVEQERLAQIQAELSRAQADRVMKQSAYEIAAASPPDSVPQVLDHGRLGTYQAQLADLRRQLAELTSEMTPAHYRVARVQSQIKDLEDTFRRERDNIMARIRNEYNAAVRRETVLAASYNRQARLVSEQAGKTVNYDILRREVESNRKLYDELLERVQGAGLASAMRASNIRVVDPAIPPSSPYRPNIYRNLAMGLFSGLLLAVGLIVAADHINRSLKAPGETPYHLKVPELGVIPEGSSPGVRSVHDPGRLLTGGGEEPADMALVTWQDRPSLMAESFRSTLASILVSDFDGRRPKVILVTSAGRGEGKSSTVCNLGIALAEINQKVLLLDADMRKPHIHHVFNAPNTWGLSDLLREKTPLEDMPLEALARETEIAGLYILPSGTGAVSIANLLYSNRTAELIDRLRLEFDMVLIDTPPMLYIADARVLGRLADASILVVRAGRTTRDAALNAKQRLEDDRIPVLGTILNGWDPRSKTRYGYYTYPGEAGNEA